VEARRPVTRVPRVRALAAVAALTVALGLGAAACSSARSELGTTNGPCFIALPTAKAAVHSRGHLIGVRLVTWGQLHSTAPYRALAKLSVARPQRLCLVAFGGRFNHVNVERPVGKHRHGVLAIVVVRYPQNRLLATVVVRHSPTAFGHPHLGGA
jgi:hypothetical protein